MMKSVVFMLICGMMVSCTLLDMGIIINPPNLPSVNVCDHIATDSSVAIMKEKIDAQGFKDERMDRAKYVTNGHCFVSSQVVEIMGSMVFPDAELEIAKRLYRQTTDKENYDIVIDTLDHRRDRNDLKRYIARYR